MADRIDDGDAPAFPSEHFSGMTLRDYFAAKAMQAIVSMPNNEGTIEQDVDTAYRCADAMLKARDEK